MKTEQASTPTMGVTADGGSVGKPISRVDGRLKVTGKAMYSAEGPVGGCVHAVLVQSEVSRGVVKGIDVKEAEGAPGVLLVLTHENIGGVVKLKQVKPDFMKGGVPGEMRLPLSDAKIYYGGQHVAVVVAETIEQARYGASLVKVDIAAERPVISMEDERAKRVVPEQSFGEPAQVKRGKVDGLKQGNVVLQETYGSPVETHNPMEMSATIAVWEGENLTVHDSTQYVYGSRAVLADALGIAREKVRVLCPFVGGGFGCKGFQWPHTLLAAVAAKGVGRPVKLMVTRKQMFTSVGHRPELRQELTLVADREGKLAGMKHQTVMHGSEVGEFVEACGTATTRLLYACENVEISHVIRQMNVNTPTPMRAPGECPGTWALESAMDELAVKLGMDPVELRMRNYAQVHPDNGKPWSSKHLKECYEVGAERFGWAKRDPAVGAMRDGPWKIGWGMATATYPGYRFPAAVRIRLSVEGGKVKASASCATHDLGTGAYTVFTQITAGALGLDPEMVKFELGDSSLPYGPVAGGSNSTASVSQAIADAAGKMKIALANLAGTSFAKTNADGLDLKNGELRLKNNPKWAVPVASLIGKSERGFVEVLAAPPGEESPNKVGSQAESGGEEDYAGYQKKYAFQSHGCHFVEVKVHERIPRVWVTRVVSAMDIGRVINPKTARSQVMGGVVMGIGMALMEGTEYDGRSGKPVNASLGEYLVPVNLDVPRVDVYFTNRADEFMNPLGCRGVGEIGITGVAAAVANAVFHATGKRVRELPITPDKLL